MTFKATKHKQTNNFQRPTIFLKQNIFNEKKLTDLNIGTQPDQGVVITSEVVTSIPSVPEKLDSVDTKNM